MGTDVVSEKARSKSLEVSRQSHESDRDAVIVLLAIFALEGRQGWHYCGPTEEEVRALVKLPDDRFYGTLNSLMERQKCVRHRITQEGTAGPFAHRYTVVPDVKITVSWQESAS